MHTFAYIYAYITWLYMCIYIRVNNFTLILNVYHPNQIYLNNLIKHKNVVVAQRV